MNSKEEFEKWYESDAMPIEANWFKRDRDAPDMYVQYQVQCAWKGWQAREVLFPSLTDYQKTLAMMVQKEMHFVATNNRPFTGGEYTVDVDECIKNCKRILEACKE